MKLHKVLICGGTGWDDPDPIRREIERLIVKHGKNNLIVIHGKADGADQIAGQIAQELSVHVAEVPALWTTRYRAAGPQRNSIMLALEPHEVIAFHKNLPKSRGTKDTVSKARKFRIKTKVVSK